MSTEKLDCVLPLIAKDIERFQILDKSLRYNFKDLNNCWVVVPDDEYEIFKRRIHRDIYQVLPESVLIPELKYYKFIAKQLYGKYRNLLIGSGRLRYRERFNTGGWYIQQIIKFAIVEHIETDFYLTLDADVICIKPVTYHQLVRGYRALAQIEDINDHPDWYEHAERVLGFQNPGIGCGVTPAVLNKYAVIELLEYLNSRVNPILRLFPSFWCKTLRDILKSWRSFLLRNTPWTEYTLYFSYLHKMRLFDKYHIMLNYAPFYDVWKSIWLRNEIKDRKIEDIFKSKSYFGIVQSSTEIEISELWQAVDKYLK
jgi:hypothetical protein